MMVVVHGQKLNLKLTLEVSLRRDLLERACRRVADRQNLKKKQRACRMVD